MEIPNCCVGYWKQSVSGNLHKQYVAHTRKEVRPCLLQLSLCNGGHIFPNSFPQALKDVSEKAEL
jgi:hypothetical protein